MNLKILENGNILITTYVKPNSKKNEIYIMNDDIYIRIQAVPEKGKANKEIIKFLAKIFDLKHNNITLIHGTTSTIKTFEISNISPNKIKEILNRFIIK